jgi:hypothetical protein
LLLTVGRRQHPRRPFRLLFWKLRCRNVIDKS